MPTPTLPLANPNANYFQPGQGGNPTPATPSAIPVSTLQTPPTPLNVQTAPTVPVPPIVPNIAPAPTATPAAPAPTDLTSRLGTLTAQLAGKTSDTAATTANATAPYEAQLNQLNTQIAQQQAQALAHQEAALRSGETTGYATREAQNVQRTDAIALMGLQALQAGIQGNIALAEKHAQAAIDTKYGQIEQDLYTAKSNIYANYDSFTPAEKKQADATLLRLDANDAFVKNAKEDEKTIYAMAVAAAKNFPNDPAAQYAVQKALQTSDLTAAFNLLGKYQADPVALQAAITDQKLKEEQLRQAPLKFATEQKVAQANIAQSYASADASKASAAASRQQTQYGKPSTQAQFTEAGYASRLAQSGAIIDSLTPSVSSANPFTFGIAGQAPSFLQGSDRQQFEQAKRNFVNAVLRQESGAAISPTEFSSAEKQYFPAPGDSAATIQQKSQNRALVIRNFQNASGNAYQAPPTANPAPGTTIQQNGMTFTVNADGTATRTK